MQRCALPAICVAACVLQALGTAEQEVSACARTNVASADRFLLYLELVPHRNELIMDQLEVFVHKHVIKLLHWIADLSKLIEALSSVGRQSWPDAPLSTNGVYATMSDTISRQCSTVYRLTQIRPDDLKRTRSVAHSCVATCDVVLCDHLLLRCRESCYR